MTTNPTKYEQPKTFNWEYSPTYNLLNWVHSMMNYCAQHKCRPSGWPRPTWVLMFKPIWMPSIRVPSRRTGMTTCPLTIKSELSSDLMV